MTIVEAIKQYGLTFGDFKLASGAQSSFYLDVKAVSLHHDGLAAIIQGIDTILDNITFDSIGGPTIGADPIVGAYVLSHPGTRGFLIRSQEKQHGMGGRLVGKIKAGEKVVLVEDVVTSGGSLLDAVRFAEHMCCEIVQTIAVVDRGADTAKKFPCPFTALCNLKDLGL